MHFSSKIFFGNNKNSITQSHAQSHMGCQQSKQFSNQIQSIETSSELRIDYREIVCQDRGQIFDLYHFSNIISRSNYSIVRKVISIGSQQKRVCKIIPLNNKEYFSVISEVQFLKKLDHPNIVQIIEYFIEASFLYIIFEEIPGDQVLKEITKSNKQVSFENIVQIMQQVLSAIEYCHRRQIAHRAISINNIMLIKKDDKLLVKIIDFSQACILDCPNPHKIYRQKRAITLPTSEYSNAGQMDIFDCGFLFYCLIMGKKIKDVSHTELLSLCLQQIDNLYLPPQIEQDLKSLFNGLLSKRSQMQLSQVVSHSFFKHFRIRKQSKKTLTNLMNFNSNSHLRYLVSMYGSLNMTSAFEKAQCIMEFHNLDKNKDGSIQIKQLIQGIRNSFDVDEENARKKAQKLFQHLNKDKNESLSFSQFVAGTMKLSKILTDQFLEAMFNELDINKDKKISKQELNNLINGNGKKNLLLGKKQLTFFDFKNVMIQAMQKDKDQGEST